VAGIATWEALAPRLMKRDPPALAAGIVVWLFGRDLVANMLGAAVAGMVVARRVRSAAADAAGFPLGH
jgi:hypothetical protein